MSKNYKHWTFQMYVRTYKKKKNQKTKWRRYTLLVLQMYEVWPYQISYMEDMTTETNLSKSLIEFNRFFFRGKNVHVLLKNKRNSSYALSHKNRISFNLYVYTIIPKNWAKAKERVAKNAFLPNMLQIYCTVLWEYNGTFFLVWPIKAYR